MSKKLQFIDIFESTYSVEGAARYLQIKQGKLINWAEIELIRINRESRLLSLADLVEAYLISILIQFTGGKNSIRQLLLMFANEFEIERPLVADLNEIAHPSPFKLRTILTGNLACYCDLLRGERLALIHSLNYAISRIDYKDGLAKRFYPPVFASCADTHHAIFLDPEIENGQPVVFDRLNEAIVPTRAIASLYDEGREIDDIAKEYGCGSPFVRAAICFEANLT